MSLFHYLVRSLIHYWKWHLGLLAGVAVAAWVISGSLIVGDSVKATLSRQSELRLGKIDEAVSSGEGFISMRLAEAARKDLPHATIAPVLYLKGTVSIPGGGKRVNGVNLIGIDADFWKLSNAPSPIEGIAANQALVSALGIKPGDSIIARFEKPSLISRDAPLSGESDQTAVLNGSLAAVAADENLGVFSLKAEQTPPLNLFIPLADLQKSAEQPDNCNLLLAASSYVADGAPQSLISHLESPTHWMLGDAGIRVDPTSDGKSLRISTPRVFLPPALANAAGKDTPGVLTYLCTSAAGAAENYTAYPMITAVDSRLGVVPADLPANGMVINQWTADNLKLKVGDAVKLNYFTVTRARQLKEENADFVVHSILPMDFPGMNAEWTPDFPGVTDAANCRDWKPGIPMKTKGFIKDADEGYWQQYKATPKAFISLARGQELWSNRFGNLTSLRFDRTKFATPEAVSEHLKKSLPLADLGFVFAQPKQLAKAAVAGSMDFGSLFLSMSFFLIVTALVLAALLFLFNVEARAGQVGLLRALGFTGDKVRLIFIAESLLAAIVGAALGAFLAATTTGQLLGKLESDWSGAVAGMRFVRAIHLPTLVNGAGMTVAFVLITVWFLSGRLASSQPQRLLAGDALLPKQKRNKNPRRRSLSFWIGITCLIVAAGMAPAAAKLPRAFQPGVFFGAATFLLSGGICLCSDWLNGMNARSSGTGVPGLWSLGLRNAVRRRGRSLAIAGLLASGIFMVTALHTFHLSSEDSSGKGTGGFAFMGSSDLPIYEDLNSNTGRDVYNLDSKLLQDTQIIALRQREGEEASCLNLNQAQSPSVLGVDPLSLASSKFKPILWKNAPGGSTGWDILDSKLEDGTIPALADEASAMWALKKGLGDVVEVKDATNKPLKLRLMAFVSGTILQGHVLISEKQFLQHFPDTAGSKVYLVNTPESEAPEVSSHLTRQLQNRGLALVPAKERLAQLQGVQNTYLQIFSALGGFAMLLSTAALGLLIARNVLERRSEFALLQASGFRQSQLRAILLGEHLPLFLIAIVLGTISAVVAVWPHLADGGQAVPVKLIAMLLAGITLGGIFFCILATTLSLRGNLQKALRQE